MQQMRVWTYKERDLYIRVQSSKDAQRCSKHTLLVAVFASVLLAEPSLNVLPVQFGSYKKFESCTKPVAICFLAKRRARAGSQRTKRPKRPKRANKIKQGWKRYGFCLGYESLRSVSWWSGPQVTSTISPQQEWGLSFPPRAVASGSPVSCGCRQGPSL